jgi:hypothetical protein
MCLYAYCMSDETGVQNSFLICIHMLTQCCNWSPEHISNLNDRLCHMEIYSKPVICKSTSLLVTFSSNGFLLHPVFL